MSNTYLNSTQVKLPSGISLRKDGRFQARFTYQGIRHTLYDKDLKVLKKKLSDTKYEMEHGIYQKLNTISLEQWFQTWISNYKQMTVKQSTLLSYTTNYERYIKPHLGKKRLCDIKTLDLQKIYNNMLASGLSVGTIQIVNAIMFNLFKQAIKNELIIKNPCANIELPRNRSIERRVLTLGEQRLFLDEIENNYYRPLLLLALGTGLRIGELTALTWDDIDFDSKTLYINKTLLYLKNPSTGKYSFNLQTPKSKTSIRTIPLLDEFINLLTEYKNNTVNKKCSGVLDAIDVNGSNSYDSLIFKTRNGTPIQEVYILKTLNVISNRINQKEISQAKLENRNPNYFEPITPHTLRHTFATRAFENGLAPKTVQQLLGHSSLSMTMDLYTHVTNDVKIQEMNKLSNIFQF